MPTAPSLRHRSASPSAISAFFSLALYTSVGPVRCVRFARRAFFHGLPSI
ncbi:MAG: hypothetical protein HSCHL_2275 [Hydrogenibacillus schlegelii]|uniref:Uncharacterized protein n=1 Tax=Hydrogenibacillus schlegelii TaxID=1484 RepID=A0A2T5GES2_HYDSH|nr:MAG: hypothetical protein HSCHL_2275 [Hydrogenibacillus schlegelii]